jgi:hypothetical protein
MAAYAHAMTSARRLADAFRSEIQHFLDALEASRRKLQARARPARRRPAARAARAGRRALLGRAGGVAARAAGAFGWPRSRGGRPGSDLRGLLPEWQGCLVGRRWADHPMRRRI